MLQLAFIEAKDLKSMYLHSITDLLQMLMRRSAPADRNRALVDLPFSRTQPRHAPMRCNNPSKYRFKAVIED